VGAEPQAIDKKAAFSRRRNNALVALFLTMALLFQTVVPSKACGPETIDPIFVFEHSPDLPFDEFVKGNMGVLQQSFGRKTLVIAYRYLSGGFKNRFGIPRTMRKQRNSTNNAWTPNSTNYYRGTKGKPLQRALQIFSIGTSPSLCCSMLLEIQRYPIISDGQWHWQFGLVLFC
jgi:hypothetical protein